MIDFSEVFVSFGYSKWSRGLSCGSAPAHLLIIAGSNPARGHESLSLVSVVCCQVKVYATGRSLVQRSPTEWGLSQCDREASIKWGPVPIGGCPVSIPLYNDTINQFDVMTKRPKQQMRILNQHITSVIVPVPQKGSRSI